MALAKEPDPASKERLERLRADLADRQEQLTALVARWEREKAGLNKVGELKKQLDDLRGQAERAQRDADFEAASRLMYGEIPALERELEAASAAAATEEAQQAAGTASAPMVKEEVGPDDVADVVSAWTGIPAGRLLEGETGKLLRMEEELGHRLIGQAAAVQAVSDAVRRSRAGIADPDRPSGSFLFLGPTGVGKTELAKALAEFLFDDERAMIRIDMSEYSERHSVARLVGAPPGYVGYDEGGQLTEAVRRRPYCVILLDEVEKAHPEVFDILLQVLDDGRLTDGQGRTVDFRNTILILTSNLGSQFIADPALPEADKREKVMAVVRATFKPEFLNRLDDVIIFDALTTAELTEIVDLQVRKLADRIADRRLTLGCHAAGQGVAGPDRLRSRLRGPAAAAADPVRDRRQARSRAARGRDSRRGHGTGGPGRSGRRADRLRRSAGCLTREPSRDLTCLTRLTHRTRQAAGHSRPPAGRGRCGRGNAAAAEASNSVRSPSGISGMRSPPPRHWCRRRNLGAAGTRAARIRAARIRAARTGADRRHRGTARPRRWPSAARRQIRPFHQEFRDQVAESGITGCSASSWPISALRLGRAVPSGTAHAPAAPADRSRPIPAHLPFPPAASADRNPLAAAAGSSASSHCSPALTNASDLGKSSVCVPVAARSLICRAAAGDRRCTQHRTRWHRTSHGSAQPHREITQPRLSFNAANELSHGETQLSARPLQRVPELRGAARAALHRAGGSRWAARSPGAAWPPGPTACAACGQGQPPAIVPVPRGPPTVRTRSPRSAPTGPRPPATPSRAAGTRSVLSGRLRPAVRALAAAREGGPALAAWVAGRAGWAGRGGPGWAAGNWPGDRPDPWGTPRDTVPGRYCAGWYCSRLRMAAAEAPCPGWAALGASRHPRACQAPGRISPAGVRLAPWPSLRVLGRVCGTGRAVGPGYICCGSPPGMLWSSPRDDSPCNRGERGPGPASPAARG